MGLPDEISIAITTEGMTFEFRVSALPQGSERLFPSQASGDEFRLSPDLQAAVAREAACALDAAVSRFVQGFGQSLSGVLIKVLDGKVSPADTAAQEREAA